jgi:CHAD domain-containing protein
MGLVIDPGAPLAAEVRRVAQEQIHEALGEIDRADRDLEYAVHQARKRCKKLRALLRLSRSELGKDRYHLEQQWYRDTARELSGLRDAQQQHNTLGALAPDADAAALLPEPDPAQVPDRDPRAVLEACARRFREGRARLMDWPLTGAGFSTALRPGFQRSYAQGRKRLKAASREPTAEALHHWRKAVKYYLYQLKLLRGAWPALLRVHYHQVKRLGEYLGDHQDLQVLSRQLQSRGAPGTETLLARLEKRQQKLRRRALRLGRRIYAERPGALARRVERYWELAEEAD